MCVGNGKRKSGMQMLKAILLLFLERVVVSGKSIAYQDTDVITFANDLFCDTHLASSPESGKRNVLWEKGNVAENETDS